MLTSMVHDIGWKVVPVKIIQMHVEKKSSWEPQIGWEKVSLLVNAPTAENKAVRRYAGRHAPPIQKKLMALTNAK